ncbi:UNVERIFIED_CONTAM: hypothetical protein Slati_2227300 [Sesamum latifolium]|uniref:Uncharacterized protein n=1 Tax=Sesamum latifolium TaxID=2727402 RepID=A0AAW2WYK3_9LAMI
MASSDESIRLLGENLPDEDPSELLRRGQDFSPPSLQVVGGGVGDNRRWLFVVCCMRRMR